MAISILWSLLLVLVLPTSILGENQTYIIHMNRNHKPLSYATHAHWYAAQLQSLSIDAGGALLYTYHSSFPGFSAFLSPSQAQALRLSPSVLGIYTDTVYDLHTTRTPFFLGLDDAEMARRSEAHIDQASQDVVIGVLDTGVWPESPSFQDSEMPEIPSRWRGTCEAAVDIKPSDCNRKLIGARSFSKGYRMAMEYRGEKAKEAASARDRDGHGTHTASTAAGVPAANASLLGYAPGTARGMAPRARVAAYKVCWLTGCFSSDILAGMDAAISDGVDVLSLSLGGGSAPYYRDVIAIGAFSAIQRGIVVSCSAGNSGPTRSSLANVAPWILTVGAGTLDRDFPAYVSLSNGKRYAGVSLYSGEGMGGKVVPVVYNVNRGAQANVSTNLCLPGTLDPNLVRGKVVFCDRGVNARVEKGLVVREAGGVGMILANTAANGEELVADSHLLPAVAVGRKIGDLIREYVRSDRNPTAVLSFGGTVLNVKPSPVVAAFSSRGPNRVTPEILKPDLIGPGVNILAGWSESVGPTGLEKDTRKTKFNIMSGTSMSCPHISGVAALLKAAHPDWSASAVKSALMTTAYTHDNTLSPLRDAAGGAISTPFAHGAGHVDPQKALSPGLVYDITTDDYIAFLCSLNYTVDHVRAIAMQPNLTCSRRLSNPGNLNYPSFSILFSKKRRVVKYSREVTNVGPAGSRYNVTVGGPANVRVMVKPTELVFKRVGDKLRYSVMFVSKKGANLVEAFGWIVWSNEQYQVKSPVAYAWE
ncbi:subtilisin-like protease SBT1.8 [Magnolia sinica]|uniref:subtilisin-like protease SBT1.8 n=1 Tax=Magnolia sinica TaxID=86752 RepID=UPI002658FE62|nr:subtilisin-like protease SBT1.8 [Magnolia sinica]